jgi:hypothetical protein
MRATSVLRTLLAFQHTFVTGVHFEHDAFVIDVAPSRLRGLKGEFGREGEYGAAR